MAVRWEAVGTGVGVERMTNLMNSQRGHFERETERSTTASLPDGRGGPRREGGIDYSKESSMEWMKFMLNIF